MDSNKRQTASQPTRLGFAIHDLNFWGGQERSTLQIATRLAKRWPSALYSYSFSGQEAQLTFHRIRPHFTRPVLLKSAFYHLATLAIFGWKSITSPLFGKPRTIVHATGACSIASDVVQVQFVQHAWKKALERLGPSFLESLRRSGIRGLYHRFLIRYDMMSEKLAYSRRKTYIAISQSVANELKDSFGIVENVHIIPHGVDSAFFCAASGDALTATQALRASLGIKPNDVVILFVGTYARKGLSAAIEALALLPTKARETARLVAVGDGNHAHFLKVAKSLGVEQNLILVHHQKNILPYFQMSDIFLQPTLYEPFGLVILEAMSCGLACVVSRLAGAAELIKERESGSLINDPTDPKEIAQLLLPLIENKSVRQTMGAAARSVAQNRSWDIVAKEYADVVETLIASKARPL